MMDYDPNLVSGAGMVRQTVRLTFGWWCYRKTVDTVVDGNCRGLLAIIDCAIANVREKLSADSLGHKVIILRDEFGEALRCSDEDSWDDEFLNDMLISAEIVGLETAEGK